jgi:hypothetical protein
LLTQDPGISPVGSAVKQTQGVVVATNEESLDNDASEAEDHEKLAEDEEFEGEARSHHDCIKFTRGLDHTAPTLLGSGHAWISCRECPVSMSGSVEAGKVRILASKRTPCHKAHMIASQNFTTLWHTPIPLPPLPTGKEIT